MKKLLPRGRHSAVVASFRAVLFIAAFLLTGFQAAATHFRYATYSWSRDLTYSGPGVKINFKVTESWRRGFSWPSYNASNPTNPTPGQVINFGGLFPINFGDGAQQNVLLTVTSIPATDVINGEFNTFHIYTNPGNYLVFFEGTARFSTAAGLQNNGDLSFRAETMVTINANPNIINNAPVSALPPILNMVVNQNPATYQIPATDPDGDALTFSLAPSASFTQAGFTPVCTQPAGLTVSPSGLISFITTAPKAINQLYNAVVRITDSKGAYVHLDVLIKITGPSAPPVFDYGVTPGNNFTYNIIPGQTLNFLVRATDPDVADNVTLFGNSIPIGAILAPGLPFSGAVNAPVQTNFSWTPTAAQVGSYVMTFIAQDPQGVQTPTTVKVNVTCATSFVASVTDADCNNPGSITITTTGGAAPFEFSNNGGATYTSGASPFTFPGLAPSTYGLRVREGNGCVTADTRVVALTPDTDAPVITCPASITVSATSGVCGAVVNFAATATDNCTGSPTITYSQNPGTVFPVGTTTVTATATDASSNTDQCTFDVIVTDNEAPAFFSYTAPVIPKTISGLGRASTYSTVHLNGGSNVAVVNPGAPINLTATWNSFYDGGAGCPGCITQHYVGINGVFNICHNAGSGSGTINTTFNAPTTPGVYYISQSPTWYYYCGQYGVPGFNNTVGDAIAVVVVQGCRADIAVNADPGTCAATVSFATPVATDNCSGVTVAQTTGLASGSAFPVGSTTNTFVATDASGNTTSCSFKVVVTDTEGPVAPVLADVTGECSATATVPTTTDNCSGTVTGTTSDPLSYTAQGSYVIHWTFSDTHGNSTMVDQNVIVHDVTAPVAPTLATITEQCAASVPTPATTDNCIGAVTGTTTDPLSYTAQGTYTVNWTFSDGNGNSSTVAQTVIVNDNTAPVITCPGDALLNCQDDNSPTATGSATATDNCAMGTITSSDVSTQDPNVNAAGHYNYTITRTWTATDVNSNSSTCNQVITVHDVTAPTASCKPATVTLSGGTASITPASVNNGSSDNCGPVTLVSVSPSTFSCANAGQNVPVVLTVADASGNTATCTAMVTVVGVVPNCAITVVPANNIFTGGVPTNLYLGYGPQSATLSTSPGAGTFTYAWSGPTSYLNCTNCQSPVFTPTLPGTYTYTVVITSSGGCSKTCTVTFCVKDIRVAGKGNNDKVYICHVPGGNMGNANTLSISVNAVASHLTGHVGDQLGQCGQTCGTALSKGASGINIDEEDLSVKAFPNPFNDGLHVRIESHVYETADVIITDLTGRKMEFVPSQPTGSDIVVGQKLAPGIYIIEVRSGDASKKMRIVKMN